MKNGYLAPLRGREATQMKFLFFLRHVVAEDQSLKPRMQAMKIWWRFCGLNKQLDTIMHQLIETVPQPKRDQFLRTMDMQELFVTARGGAVDPSGDLMVVPRKAFLKVLSTASKECMLCDGEPNERKKCPYRRAIKDLVLTDLSLSEDDGICMGKKMDWEG